MKLGKNILKLRKKKGFSQEELGEKIGVTRQTISNWELGETSPNPEQLVLLSKELSVSVDELLDNNVQNILVEKVSNTEQLASLILKIIKVFVIIIVVGSVLTIIGAFIFQNVTKETNDEDIIEESIYCKIYGEEHGYNITYNQSTGNIIKTEGDNYFHDILDLNKYTNANQILNIINDYVKKNSGTCEKIKNRDLNELVDISIKEGTLTKKGLTIIIKENIDYNITYGEDFYIEKYNYKNSKYDKIENTTENNCAFNAMGYIVSPDHPLEMNQNWSCDYDELPKGIYRLVKRVSFDSDRPIDDNKLFYIWLEFEIE